MKPIRTIGIVNGANTIGATLREMLHKEIRVTVLGYIQHGRHLTGFWASWSPNNNLGAWCA